MSEQKGILVVISGFSGAGKGTLMKELLTRHPEDYSLSVSATTRNPRPGEVDGQSYFFLSKEAFEKKIEENAFLEHACYVGNYYGTPKDYVVDQLKTGKCVILEIEIQGALNIKKQLGDTKLIFVTAPSAEELKNRLVGRQTETPEVIAQRLSRASEEASGIDNYDYLLVNDDLSESTERLHTMIQQAKNHQEDDNLRYQVKQNAEFVNKMQQELKSFSKGEN